MKQFSLLFFCVFVYSFAWAQFNPEKYFTDSVSFSYEKCRPVDKKETKKGIKSCTPYKYRAAISPPFFNVTEVVEYSKAYAENKDSRKYEEGLLSSIDFSRSQVVKQEPTSVENTSNPPQIYELRLHAKRDKPQFTSISAPFPEATTLAIYLYFASQDDAWAAEKYLKSRLN